MDKGISSSLKKNPKASKGYKYDRIETIHSIPSLWMMYGTPQKAGKVRFSIKVGLVGWLTLLVLFFGRLQPILYGFMMWLAYQDSNQHKLAGYLNRGKSLRNLPINRLGSIDPELAFDGIDTGTIWKHRLWQHGLSVWSGLCLLDLPRWTWISRKFS